MIPTASVPHRRSPAQVPVRERSEELPLPEGGRMMGSRLVWRILFFFRFTSGLWANMQLRFVFRDRPFPVEKQKDRLPIGNRSSFVHGEWQERDYFPSAFKTRAATASARASRFGPGRKCELSHNSSGLSLARGSSIPRLCRSSISAFA